MTNPYTPPERDTEPLRDSHPSLDPVPDTRSEDEVFDQTLPPAHEEDDLILGAPADDHLAGDHLADGDRSSRSEQATQEAGKVAGDAKEGGQRVAHSVTEEVGHVASTMGDQARSLLDQTRSELSSQAGTQQQKVTEGIRTLGDDLQSLADGSPQEGMALDLARQAAERTQGVASWLEGREPADLLTEVQGFARRRPGTFIAIAAGVGLLAGRFTRGLTQDKDSSSPTSPAQGATGGQGFADSQDVTGGHGLAGGTTPDAGYAPRVATAPVASTPATAPDPDPYADTTGHDSIPVAGRDPFLPGTTGPGQR
ncbi:hypothetical protein [Serinicoccus sp. LYQ131]|uniref:hypothetical protein n=1 Tax=Serinicoccus sp. LYQ131 TaxID=3378797 RepID=UPI003854BB07